MRKYLFSALISLLILIGTMDAYASPEFPDWVEGVLCFNTLTMEEGLNKQQAIVFYDFDTNQTLARTIPSEARVVVNKEYHDNPVLVYQDDGGKRKYNLYEIVNDPDRYNLAVAELVNSRQSEEFLEFSEGFGTETVTGRRCNVSGPHGEIKDILGVCSRGSDIGDYYCLRYACSDTGEIVMQLIRESTSEILDYPDQKNDSIVYYTFDIDDTTWKNLYYAISDDGKLVWKDIARGRMFASDGVRVTCLEETDNFSTASVVYWLDEETVVFFRQCVTDEEYFSTDVDQRYCMAAWNIVSGEVMDITSLTGGLFVLNARDILNIAANSDGLQFAVEYTDWNTLSQRIAIFDLIEGNQFDFQVCAEYSQGENRLFGMTDDGIRYYEPNSGIKSTLIWIDVSAE